MTNLNDMQQDRNCGAVCLRHVYAGLGQAVGVEEIWRAIAKQNSNGSIASTTHLMVRDARSRGFAAVAIQSRRPLQSVRVAVQQNIPCILNLRASKHATTGHYSVLAGIDANHIALLDPPTQTRPVGPMELLQLWQRAYIGNEITGNILIAVAAPSNDYAACWHCDAPLAPELVCPGCKEKVQLRPAAALGCMSDKCLARLWDYVCCPECDNLFNEKGEFARAQPEAAALERLFSALDNFNGLIATTPAVAHPDVRTQMDFIAQKREELKTSLPADMAKRAMVMAQFADAVRIQHEAIQAAQRQAQQANELPPKLDGYALGQDLLKTVGLNGEEPARLRAYN